LVVVLPLLPATPTTGPANCAPAPGGARQRRLAVVHLDDGQRRRLIGPVDDGGHGAGLGGGLEEVIAVEARAAQRQVHLARLERARVVVDVRPLAVLAGEAAAAQRGQVREGAPHAPTSCSALTTRRSLNGRT